MAPDENEKEKKPEPPPLTEGGATSPKRALPNYDGRGEPPTTAGDVALWIPRALLSPFYLVSEFALRRPLITTAERNQWPAAIRDFFTFGPEKKAGVVPTAFLDFGFRASVGVYAFWDDLLGPGNHLRLHATTLGVDWLQGAIADKIPLGENATVDFRLEGTHQPDNIFHGLGPRSIQDDRTRFGIDRIQAHPVFEMSWWRSGHRRSSALSPCKKKNRRDEDPRQCREQLAVVGEALAPWKWEREHPLPERYSFGKDMLDEVRGGGAHPSSEARWAEPSPFARERHEARLIARVALESSEASIQESAVEKSLELLLHEPR